MKTRTHLQKMLALPVLLAFTLPGQANSQPILKRLYDPCTPLSVTAVAPQIDASTAVKATPCLTGATEQSGLDAVDGGYNSLSERFDSLRDGNATTLNTPDDASRTAAVGSADTGARPTPMPRHGVWTKMGSYQAKLQDSGATPGYKSRSGLYTIGVDKELDDGTTVGVAFTHSDSDINANNASSSGSRIRGYQGSVYATRDYGAFHLDGVLAYAYQNTHGERIDALSNARSRYSSDVMSARVTIGKTLPTGYRRINVTPFASLQVDRLSREGYDETGTGAVHVDRNSVTRTRSGLGARVYGDMNIGNQRIKPSLHMQWLHDYSGTQVDSTGSGIGGGGTFTATGIKRPGNMANMGMQVLVPLARRMALTLGYNLYSGGGYRAQGYDLTWQYYF